MNHYKLPTEVSSLLTNVPTLPTLCVSLLHDAITIMNQTLMGTLSEKKAKKLHPGKKEGPHSFSVLKHSLY